MAMESKKTKSEGTLTIYGSEPSVASVPAEILVKAIDGLQQTVYLLAASRTGRTLNQRFRPSAETKRKFSLQCQVPEPGSYAMPVSVVDQSPQIPMEVGPEEPILDDAFRLFSALEQENRGELSALLPDSGYRQRAIQTVRKYIPRAGDAWTFGFNTPRHTEPVKLASRHARGIDRLVSEVSDEEQEETTMTVTGTLVGVDFEECKITIKYAPTKRHIDCTYLPQVEDMIVENRRELVQVTGTFTLDGEGNPNKLSGVTRIEPLDLDAMTFRELEFDGRVYKFEPPLCFEPVLDDSEQLIVVEDPSLSLHVFAQTREQLEIELAEQIDMLWAEYATEEDDKLTDDAKLLKAELLKRARKVA